MLKDVIILLPELSKASFVERLNRFVGLVDVAGQVCPAHVSSSGRMRELLFPGNIVYVSPLPAGKRTQYRIHLAHHGETLVSVDSCCRTGLFISPCYNKPWLNLELLGN